jgi:hypothetical protein
MGTGGSPDVPDDMGMGGTVAAPAGDAGLPGCGEAFGTLGQAVLDATTLEAEYITYDGNSNGQISFHVRLRNTGVLNVPLGGITARYWYTPEVAMSTIKLDSVSMDIMGAEVAFKETPDGSQQYLEVSYPEGVSLMRSTAANSADIAIRLEPVQVAGGNNVENDQENDWSWKPMPTGAWGENPKITLYRVSGGMPALLSGSSPCD